MAAGSFSVLLDFGATAFTGADRFIEVMVRRTGTPSYTVLLPRQQVASAPYSLVTTDAAKLGGVSAIQYVQTSDARLTDARTPLAGSNNYLQNSTQLQTASFNVSGSGAAQTSLSGGSGGIVGVLGGAYGVYGETNELQGTAVRGNASSTGGSFATGVYGSADSSAGIGVAGLASSNTGNTYGVYGRSFSDSGAAVFGTNNGSGTATGVWGQTFSSSGRGVYGQAFNGGFAGYFDGKVTVSGNVGVGTPSPSANLHVEGTSGDSIYAHSQSGYGIHARSEQNYAGYFEGYVYFANLAFLPVLGGAGSTALCRNGSKQISTCSSSRRYKTAIQPFSEGLDVVRRLRPVRFDWKDSGVHDLGLVAEEVASVEPLLTFRNAQGEIEGVKYDQLAAVFVSAFKEQQTQIDALQQPFTRQSQIISLLQQRLNALSERPASIQSFRPNVP